ncbi:hypothetical protein EYC80_009682 [Monilinia laxa]|uniref:Uncharacterized protein n=1 Tax=Monilinia laxa TaxID=61186 RepID=A0A5N6JYZ2_MONLA|nr:hypothetical protein EYC80_009682 [Monilinia laxa]
MVKKAHNHLVCPEISSYKRYIWAISETIYLSHNDHNYYKSPSLKNNFDTHTCPYKSQSSSLLYQPNLKMQT